MVVQVETQDRVRHLLKEALPMLCRSGLSFASEFCVEALIGITLNKNDVFLVSIKETVKSEEGDEAEKSVEVEVTRAGESQESPGQRRKPHRKRRRSKSSPSKETQSDSEDGDTTHTDDYEDASNIKREKLEMVGSIADYDNTGSVQTGSDTNATSSDIKTKSVHEDESNDAIIVKEEPAETDFSGVSFGDISSGQGFDMSGFSQAAAHPLASSTLSSPQNQSLPGTSYSQPVQMIPNLNQQGADSGQSPGAQGSMMAKLSVDASNLKEKVNSLYVEMQGQWICSICSKPFRSRKTVTRHIEEVHFNINAVTCRYCSSSFGSRRALVRHIRRKKCKVLNNTEQTRDTDCSMIHPAYSQTHERYGREAVIEIHNITTGLSEPREWADDTLEPPDESRIVNYNLEAEVDTKNRTTRFTEDRLEAVEKTGSC